MLRLQKFLAQAGLGSRRSCEQFIKEKRVFVNGKVAVLGTGVMGGQIAAHLTNAGCNVNLLDIVIDKRKNRNYLADEAVKRLIKIKPSPITSKSNLKLITTGNIEDNLEIINTSECVTSYIQDLTRKVSN